MEILRDATHGWRRLPLAIRAASQAVVAEALKETHIDRIIRDAGLTAQEVADWIKSQVESARPRLLACGGSTRLLLAVPERAPVTSIAGFIESQYDEEANVVAGTCGDFVVCYEVENVPLEHIAISLIELRPDCAELVPRLHTRCDVNWTNLTQLC